MSSLSLIKKYPDVDPAILYQYKKADKFLWVNTDDKDLMAIRIDLPLPPEPHKIEGFGKLPKDQYWEPPKLPRRLKELQRKHETIDDIWDELQKNQDIFAEEIKFIKKQWYYRLNGYWIYIDGKPTYMDGWHFFYCGWWKIDVGLPKYRNRDYKFFHFARMCYKERRTFKIVDMDRRLVAFKDLSYGNITSWKWDFGDGTISNEQNPIHLYEKSGTTYVVILEVEGPEGKAHYSRVWDVLIK